MLVAIKPKPVEGINKLKGYSTSSILPQNIVKIPGNLSVKLFSIETSNNFYHKNQYYSYENAETLKF